MPDSVYKVIELIGTSTESWEKAAKAAVDRAAKSLRDLRVAEVVQQDMRVGPEPVVERRKLEDRGKRLVGHGKPPGHGGRAWPIARALQRITP